MTPLTASGWLWLGWCVFAVIVTVSHFLDCDHDDSDVTLDLLATVLSLAWLGWLVAP